jgi:hypothetical protein
MLQMLDYNIGMYPKCDLVNLDLRLHYILKESLVLLVVAFYLHDFRKYTIFNAILKFNNMFSFFMNEFFIFSLTKKASKHVFCWPVAFLIILCCVS